MSVVEKRRSDGGGTEPTQATARVHCYVTRRVSCQHARLASRDRPSIQIGPPISDAMKYVHGAQLEWIRREIWES